jgi:glycosyltransferase involved in cell wall biosynthesis
MKTFVVIPAYNEATRIRQVLQSLKDLPYEVVVVDDASSDTTAEIVKDFLVYLLQHKVNRGQGATLETGNQFALQRGAAIIVHFDADGQFVAKEIDDLIQPLIKQEADIVFGSRFLQRKANLPKLKKYLFFPVARLVNRFLGIKLTDPQNGFRAMSRSTAEQIQIEQDGWAHCTEIAAKAFGAKLRIREVPTTVIYHEFGQNFTNGLKIIKDLLLAKFNK